VAERSLRFDLIGRDRNLGRTLAKGERDLDRFGRNSRRSFERAGDDGGRRYGMRLSKSLGGGMSASAGVVRKGAGLIAAGFAAAGVASFAKDSIQMAATFDKTMRQTAAVAKVPTSQIKDLRDVALDMGAKTSFSARQAGEAMLELGKGGLSFAQMKAGALSSTLTLAAAGGIELGEAAGYVVKGLTAFGLKADKAATVAAALAGGANASTASVEDMGLALAQVGQGARSAGLSIQETTAVLAAFSDNGIRGADAGTSLKTMLARLVPQTDKQSKAMRRLGLDFVDAHGAILPISAIAQQLQDRLKGLSQAQRIAAMNTVFGSDATRAATILMNEGSAGLAKYVKATNDRSAAEKLAKTNTQGAAGAFERLSGAVETLQIRAGDTLLPMLADVATTIADRILPAVSKWVNQFRSDLLPHLGRMRDAWNENKGALGAFAASLATSQGDLASTGDKAKTLADAVVGISHAAGDASRFLTSLGQGLNSLDSAADSAGMAIHTKFFGPMFKDFAEFGRWSGANALFSRIARDVKADLADIGIKLGSTADNATRAASAADKHAAAVRGEKQALVALKGALDEEKTSELGVRQAKLNVAVAQKRLTDLKRAGRKGSLEYRQAQIDLARAQLALKGETQRYRVAVLKSSEAERAAAFASGRAAAAANRLRAQTLGARREVTRFGIAASEAFAKLKSKTVSVKANYNIGAPKGVELLIEKGLVRAAGGSVRGQGTTTSDSIPARLSDQEHVVEAKAVKGLGGGSFARGHQALEGMRSQWRGYAAGGPVLNFRQHGANAFIGRPGRFDRNLARSLDLMARGFGRLVRLNSDKIFGMGKPAIKAFIRSVDPLPYRWGAAGPSAYDCSGLVGAVAAKHAGRPGGHGQRYFTTSTIRPGILGLKSGLGGTLEVGVTPSRGHMVGRYGGLGFEARSTRTGIFTGTAARSPRGFARHFHLAQGGRVTLEDLLASGRPLDVGGDAGVMRVKRAGTFDRGGYLMPGTTVAHNRTGKPERVLPPGPVVGRREAKMIAEELAAALRANPAPVYLDRQKVSRAVADGAIWEARR
jgi:TP901 family phage tail tape measure protein